MNMLEPGSQFSRLCRLAIAFSVSLTATFASAQYVESNVWPTSRQQVVSSPQYPPPTRHVQSTADHEFDKTSRKVREVIGLLQRAKDDETRRAMATKLRGLLSEAFTRDYERRDEALKKVEQRVARLRKQLERQKETSEEVIDVRVKSLLFEVEGLGGPIEFRSLVRPRQDLYQWQRIGESLDVPPGALPTLLEEPEIHLPESREPESSPTNELIELGE